jgi:hypothetical protein
MMETKLETLHYIITKAREFDGEVEPSGLGDGSNPADDGEYSVLETQPGDITEQELRGALAGLSEDEQTELVALVWLGRGDYDRSGWKRALTDARAARTRHTVDYLMGTPLLGDYLEEGLAALGLSCTELAQEHL